MKKVLYLAMLVLGMGLLCSCSKDDKDEGEDITYNGVSITGKWLRQWEEWRKDEKSEWHRDSYETKMYYVFEKGGKGKQIMISSDALTTEWDMSYKINGNKIYLSWGGGTEGFIIYELTANELIIGTSSSRDVFVKTN